MITKKNKKRVLTSKLFLLRYTNVHIEHIDLIGIVRAKLDIAVHVLRLRFAYKVSKCGLANSNKLRVLTVHGHRVAEPEHSLHLVG